METLSSIISHIDLATPSVNVNGSGGVLLIFKLQSSRGSPHKQGMFFWNEVALNDYSCVPLSIRPQNLLEDRSNEANFVNRDRSSRILPSNLFSNKSNCSRVDIHPREPGISPSKWFLDRFSNLRLLIFPTLSSIFLLILLHEKSSMVFDVSTYSTLHSIPFITMGKSSYNVFPLSFGSPSFPNPWRLPRLVGIPPSNFLFDNSSTNRFMRFYMDGGR